MLDRNEAQRMERRSAVVAKELEKIGVDVAALQETRLEGSGMIKEKEFSIFWSGVEAGERRQAGVSLAVRNDVLKKMNTLPKAISDRIIVMRLPLSNNKFATITYAPTTTYPEPEKEEHYRSLSDVVGRVPAADKLAILGDFNARVGSDHELYRPALGKFGKGSCNSNGELLLNFCMQFGLVVTNTYFNQSDCNYYTWKHPRSKKFHLLDYVITRNEHKSEVLNTKAMRGPESATDHYIVVSKLRFHLALRGRKAPQVPKKFDVKKLKSEDVKDEFNAKLRTKISELRQTKVAEEKWSRMKDVFAKNLYGRSWSSKKEKRRLVR